MCLELVSPFFSLRAKVAVVKLENLSVLTRINWPALFRMSAFM